MRRIYLLSAGLLLSASLQAQSTVKGYVYADLNANRKQEKNEKGIAAVAVTNGKEVVLTDKKGYYELPVSKDQIISVIKPSGYKVPLNCTLP